MFVYLSSNKTMRVTHNDIVSDLGTNVMYNVVHSQVFSFSYDIVQEVFRGQEDWVFLGCNSSEHQYKEDGHSRKFREISLFVLLRLFHITSMKKWRIS